MEVINVARIVGDEVAVPKVEDQDFEANLKIAVARSVLEVPQPEGASWSEGVEDKKPAARPTGPKTLSTSSMSVEDDKTATTAGASVVDEDIDEMRFVYQLQMEELERAREEEAARQDQRKTMSDSEMLEPIVHKVAAAASATVLPPIAATFPRPVAINAITVDSKMPSEPQLDTEPWKVKEAPSFFRHMSRFASSGELIEPILRDEDFEEAWTPLPPPSRRQSRDVPEHRMSLDSLLSLNNCPEIDRRKDLDVCIQPSLDDLMVEAPIAARALDAPTPRDHALSNLENHDYVRSFRCKEKSTGTTKESWDIHQTKKHGAIH